MTRTARTILWSSMAITAGACCGTAPKPPQQAMVEAQPEVTAAAPDAGTAPVAKAGPRIEPLIWMTPEAVVDDCGAGLERAETLRRQVIAVSGGRDTDNTLTPINDLLIEVYNLLSTSELMANVHPEEAVRTAAEKCQQDAVKFITELELDREVYDALVAVRAEGLDALTKRFLDHLIRDYKLAGVDKDEAIRKKLAALQEEMLKASQDFARAIRESRRSITVGEADLTGLPEGFAAAHETDDGKYTFTTDYPDFMPVVTYADKESVRKALYMEFLKRAHPQNDENLKKLLTLRYDYAALLGYSDWAEYNAQDKMASSEKIIVDFIEKVSDIARPRMKRDLKALLKRKKEDVKTATTVRVWDRFYYADKIRNEQFGVDGKALRAYFPYDRVIAGILDFNAAFFGLTFDQLSNAPVWHDDVAVYNVLESGELIGRFYLDMHPRDGKYSHAAQFSMLTGVTGRQLPSGALVCNFPKPSQGAPALLEHDQVVTVFHEFGHLMHEILSGRYPWVTLSGNATERDFVEVPSQLLEKWAWQYEVLEKFAVNEETGEAIPEDLVKKMNDADKFARGVHVMRQMSFAALSYTYHASDPRTFDLLKVLKQVQKKYNPYPYEKGTYFYDSFGHLDSYSSLYYTYMWSLALSEDMFTRFEKEGIMNPDTARDLRDKVLEPGGTVDAADMVKDFLGREQRFDALEAYLKDQ